jgi:hypothetical protein
LSCRCLSGSAKLLARPALFRPARISRVTLVKLSLHFLALCIMLGMPVVRATAQPSDGSWVGVLSEARGKIIFGARIELRESTSGRVYTSTAGERGNFSFPALLPRTYEVRIRWNGKVALAPWTRKINSGDHLNSSIQIDDVSSPWKIVETSTHDKPLPANSGQNLSNRQVSELPLNKRDFSQLLLLAAGTMTDTNGSASFTQQFAVNGQRGAYAVFAMDGVDATDPELGGATFTNFNVDAVQEIQSVSGVMAAEFGHGAAGFTNIKTKSEQTCFTGRSLNSC